MTRPARRRRLPLFPKTATTLSLALSLVALAVLPVSFFRAASLVRTNPQSSVVVRVVTGYVVVTDQRGPGMTAFFQMTGQSPQTWSTGFDPTTGVKVYWEYALLPGYFEPAPLTTASGTLARRVLILPLWFLAAVLSLPRTLPPLLRRLTRQSPPPAGHCPACGYDLRATPTRCPECGTIPQTQYATASDQSRPPDPRPRCAS